MKKWLPLLVFAAFAYYLVFPNFGAKLGIIDDHEIALFLGNDGKIKPLEIPGVIIDQTEVGKWGSYLRYRPSYYTLRVIETALWRDNATMWYVSRYLMLVLSLFLGWKILSIYFPRIVSYLVIFYMMTMPFWPDILTRLGPSEIYALPAVLLFTYGLIKNELWMISLGYLIAVGSKENLLILFPILLLWVLIKFLQKKLNKTEVVAVILMTIYTLFIVGGILVATAKAGTDVYGTQISYRYRITRFVWDIPKIIQDRHILPALLILVIGIFTKKFRHVGVGIIILAVAATQYIFYINQLPSNMRYDFPALLLFPILDLVAILLLLAIFAKHKYAKSLKILMYVGLSTLCIFYIFHRGYTLIHNQAIKNSKLSSEFDSKINKAVYAIRENPDATIVFVSSHSHDFEPIVSVQRYLDSKKISNILMLQYIIPFEDLKELKADPLAEMLQNAMKGIANEDRLFKRFTTYKEPKTPCYSITFSGTPASEDCPVIANF